MDVHVDHNVYILGAGFSVEAGLPTVSDFMDRMRHVHDALVRAGDDGPAAQAIRTVLDWRVDAANAAYNVQVDLDDFEELFSLAVLSQREDVTAAIPTAVAATIVRLQDARAPGAHRFLSHRVRRDEGGEDDHLYAGLIARLLGRAPTSRDTFVSFNYDTVVELALRHLGRSWDYGVPSLGETRIQPGHDARPPVSLLKLHGSINWTRDEADTVQATHPGQAPSPTAGRPFILPPIWAKLPSDILIETWRAAVDALRSATRIAIIGFSAPRHDEHFRYLLAAGLRENISLEQVVLVNPCEDACERTAAMFPTARRRGRITRFARLTDPDHLAELSKVLGRG